LIALGFPLLWPTYYFWTFSRVSGLMNLAVSFRARVSVVKILLVASPTVVNKKKYDKTDAVQKKNVNNMK
jgi:hypothetical protein